MGCACLMCKASFIKISFIRKTSPLEVNSAIVAFAFEQCDLYRATSMGTLWSHAKERQIKLLLTTSKGIEPGANSYLEPQVFIKRR